MSNLDILFPNNFPIPYKDMGIVSLLSNSSLASTKAGEKCAIVRWFDEDTLLKYVEVKSPKTFIRKLNNSSLIETSNYGYSLHDVVREEIIYSIKHKRPDQYFFLHNKAKEYYHQRILRTSKLFSQPLLIEYFYHLIHANDDEGFVELEKTIRILILTSQVGICLALLDTTTDITLKVKHQEIVKNLKSLCLNSPSTRL